MSITYPSHLNIWSPRQGVLFSAKALYQSPGTFLFLFLYCFFSLFAYLYTILGISIVILNTAVKSKSGMIFSFPPSIAPQGMARWWWTGGLVFCLDKMQVVNLEQARLDIN